MHDIKVIQPVEKLQNQDGEIERQEHNLVLAAYNAKN